MRVRISMVLAALAASLLLPGIAAARGDSAAAAARADHDRVLAYWTPARIAAARWRDFSIDARTGKVTANKGKPGGGTGGTSTGASWNGGGQVSKSVGRILFSAGGSQWICSGTVVAGAGNKRLLGRPVSRPLRLRRGRRLVLQLRLLPELRRRADLHLRRPRQRLLDGHAARDQQRLLPERLRS